MRPRIHHLLVVASLVIPGSAVAGGAVLPTSGHADPAPLDVRMAIAASPSGTTRWTDITIPASTRILWLVPARPGADVTWAADSWLPALEEATAPRVVRPVFATSCSVADGAERTMPWTVVGTKKQPVEYTVLASADAVRDAAATRGFGITSAIDARLEPVFASGFQLLAFEIESSAGAVSSGTLRVRDDGGALLPLALTGSRAAQTRITAFTIGAGIANTADMQTIDGSALVWGPTGSNFTTWRRETLRMSDRETWLRESASHAALFDGTTVTGSSPVPSVVTQYLGTSACAAAARDAGGSDGVVGTSLPASTFACGGLDDLAVALDGLAPRSAIVTRFNAVIPLGELGSDRAVTFDGTGGQSPPVVRATAYVPCSTSSSGSPGAPLSPSPTGGADEYPDDTPTSVVYVSNGCGGDTTSTTEYEEDSSETTTTTSDEGCGGDSTTSTSSDDGWDSSDDGDSCGSDTSSSSSSSDSCSGGSSSSSSGGSDDGWDTEDDGMSPKSKKTSLRTRPKSKSPFSRLAIFAVALVLPLRRRARVALGR